MEPFAPFYVKNNTNAVCVDKETHLERNKNNTMSNIEC